MEKVRYYAIKGPDGRLESGTLSCHDDGAWSWYYRTLELHPSVKLLSELKREMIDRGYRCVEVAEVKEVEGD